MDQVIEEDVIEEVKEPVGSLNFKLTCFDRMLEFLKGEDTPDNQTKLASPTPEEEILEEKLLEDLEQLDGNVNDEISSLDEESIALLLSESDESETETTMDDTRQEGEIEIFAATVTDEEKCTSSRSSDSIVCLEETAIPNENKQPSIGEGGLAKRGKRLGNKYITVPCLKTTHEFKRAFGKKYRLFLKPKKARVSYYSNYKRKMELLVKLEEWEKWLNDCAVNEPYISVENKVDNTPPPTDFVYISQNKVPSFLDHLFDHNYLVGCNCQRCTPKSCECPKNSGGVFAYDRFGRVQFEPGKPIYECNSKCSCSESCRNRVVQRGRTVRVTIFRTYNGCGWGVKTMDPIMKNQFVTEYVGEVITNEEAEHRGRHYDAAGQTYLFDLDYNDGDCAYTIDAKKYGNISHFINHSCDPNLSVFGVWVDTLDPQMPRIAFFARRDIPAGEEITFDYLMTAGDSSPTTSPSKPSKSSNHFLCHCGAKNCRNYLF